MSAEAPEGRRYIWGCAEITPGDLRQRGGIFAGGCSIGARCVVLPNVAANACDPSSSCFSRGRISTSNVRYTCSVSSGPLKFELIFGSSSGTSREWGSTQRGGSLARPGAVDKGSRPAASTDSDGLHRVSDLTWDAPSSSTLSITTILPSESVRVNRVLRGLAAPLRPAMVSAAPSAQLKRYARRGRSRQAAPRAAPPIPAQGAGVATPCAKPSHMPGFASALL